MYVQPCTTNRTKRRDGSALLMGSHGHDHTHASGSHAHDHGQHAAEKDVVHAIAMEEQEEHNGRHYHHHHHDGHNHGNGGAAAAGAAAGLKTTTYPAESAANQRREKKYNSPLHVISYKLSLCWRLFDFGPFLFHSFVVIITDVLGVCSTIMEARGEF